MVDRVVRWGARTWAPPLAIAWCGADRALVEVGGLQTVRKGRQRLACLGFTGKGVAAQFFQRVAFLRTLLEELLIDRAFGTGPVGLRSDQDPVLFDPAIARWQ